MRRSLWVTLLPPWSRVRWLRQRDDHTRCSDRRAMIAAAMSSRWFCWAGRWWGDVSAPGWHPAHTKWPLPWGGHGRQESLAWAWDRRTGADTMMIVGSPEQAEAAWRAGEIACPHRSARLRPYGHARNRTVRGLGDTRLMAPATARPMRRLWPHPGAVAGRVVRAPSLRRGGHRDRAGGQGRGQRVPYDRRANGPARLDGAPLAPTGAGNSRPVALRTGHTARLPPQPRHPGPPQTLAEHARLGFEPAGWRGTGLPTTPGKTLASDISLFHKPPHPAPSGRSRDGQERRRPCPDRPRQRLRRRAHEGPNRGNYVA